MWQICSTITCQGWLHQTVRREPWDPRGSILLSTGRKDSDRLNFLFWQKTYDQKLIYFLVLPFVCLDNFKTTRILYFQFWQLDCLHKRLSIEGSKIALFHDQVWKDSYHLVINSFHLLLLSFKSMFAKLFDCTTTKYFLHPILLFEKNFPKKPRMVHFKYIAQVLAPPKNGK